MKQPDYPFKIAFLLSGSGSTLENLLTHIASGLVKATVSIVISSREEVYGIERAKKWGIPYDIIPYKQYKSDLKTYSEKITEILDSHQVDLVVFGGFMSHYLIPESYVNRVINIHPAIIPSFCGKGYYGIKVHKAVLEQGVKITGCTVHFVDEGYDTGPIIYQEAIKVYNHDTPESLQQRVTKLEREVYPRVIQAIVENRVLINGRKITLLNSNNF